MKSGVFKSPLNESMGPQSWIIFSRPMVQVVLPVVSDWPEGPEIDILEDLDVENCKVKSFRKYYFLSTFRGTAACIARFMGKHDNKLYDVILFQVSKFWDNFRFFSEMRYVAKIGDPSDPRFRHEIVCLGLRDVSGKIMPTHRNKVPYFKCVKHN